MLTLDQKVRPHPQVVETEVDGDTTVFLHLESNEYFSLNTTGTHVWKGVKDGLTLRAICRRLEEQFEIDASTAEKSVLDCVKELTENQLIELVQ